MPAELLACHRRTRGVGRVRLTTRALATVRLLGGAVTVASCLFGATVLAGPVTPAGVAIAGSDVTEVQLLQPLPLRNYRNLGYELRLDAASASARVQVDLEPLRSETPFRPPPLASDEPDRFEVLARAVTAGAGNHYEAISRLLSWVSRNIRYELDRAQSQTAEAVLDRRSGYCTGIARLTVALLHAVDIEAREVPGVVVAQAAGESYFHRWVEIHYPERGWAFSDPLASHHHVPATYLPLAEERVLASEQPPVELRRRVDGRQEVDVYTFAGPGVAARKNSDRQHAAALLVRFEEAPLATVVLVGGGIRRELQLSDGRGTFVGLAPGRYRLEVHGRYDQPIVHELSLPGVVRRALHLSSSPDIRGTATRGR